MNKLLIVGRGESYKDIDFIRNFEGDITLCDSVSHELIGKGIEPNYIGWLETSDETAIDMIKTLPRLDNTIVIYRYGPIPEGIKPRLKSFQPPAWCNNVGLFCIVFAQQLYHYKEIHLLGFEHRGPEYSEGWFNDMLGCFSRFYCERDIGCKLIDHSINGRLGI